MRRIAAHYLIDRSQLIARPLIEVDDQGSVVSVGEWERLDNIPMTEFYAGALSAGFVNAHSHVELSYLRGAIERNTGFGGFARAIGQVRGNYTMSQRLSALRTAMAQMWEQFRKKNFFVGDLQWDEVLQEVMKTMDMYIFLDAALYLVPYFMESPFGIWPSHILGISTTALI